MEALTRGPGVLVGEVQRFDQESRRWVAVRVLERVVDSDRPHGQFAVKDRRRVR